MVEFFDDELLLGMAEQLKLASPEEDMSVKKAIEYLNEAFDIFKAAGQTKQAAKVSAILEKITSPQPNKAPPSIIQLMNAGVSQRDLKEFEKGSSFASAKVNLALHSLGYNDQEAFGILSDKYMPQEAAFKIIASHGDSSFSSLGAKKKVDRHTKGLTSKKQVENLKDHGTVFNMSKDCAVELPPKKDTLEPEDMDPEFSDLLKSFDFNNTEDVEDADFEDEIDLPKDA